MLLLLPFFSLWSLLVVNAQIIGTRNFLPQTYPLAVRTPHFNSWWNNPRSVNNTNVWPTFLGVGGVTALAGFIRVDGVAFKWMGNPPQANSSTLRSTEVTATRTILNIDAGNVSMTVTMLSPIERSDLVKQSLPFAYISVDLRSLDGQDHSVQLYGDVSLEWLSSDGGQVATWRTTTTGQTVFHSANLQNQVPMVEEGGIARDTSLHFATRSSDEATYETGGHNLLRNAFISGGTLANRADTRDRRINDDFPILAFAKDYGRVRDTQRPFVFALGLTRDAAVTYITESGRQRRRPYFWSQYSKIDYAIDDFLNDFDGASQRATELDRSIASAALSVSPEYTNLVNMAARQAMALEVTIPDKTGERWDTSDVSIFVRDTGISQRTNPVEVLYASLPAYLWLNASYVAYALEPLLAYQSTRLYTEQYAAVDLGTSYPVAQTPSITPERGLEATSSMMIMIWAHASYSGNGSLLLKYEPLLRRWANYLHRTVSSPGDQTLDGLTVDNQSNLALMGILGLEASGRIFRALGSEGQNYTDLAASSLQDLSGRASSGRLQSTSDASSPPALIYNLYMDTLLNFKNVSDEIYEGQSNYYSSLALSARTFGLPIQGSVAIVKPQWTIFAAAVANSGTRNTLIDMIHARVNNNVLGGGFPTGYSTSTGEAAGLPSGSSGSASPVQGAMFAILALSLPRASEINVPPAGSNSGDSSSGPSKSNTGAIAGGVVGGVLFLLLLVGVFFFLRRRKARKANSEVASSTPFPETSNASPYSPYQSTVGNIYSTYHPTDPNHIQQSSLEVQPSQSAVPLTYSALHHQGSDHQTLPTLSPQRRVEHEFPNPYPPTEASYTDTSSSGPRQPAGPLPSKRPLPSSTLPRSGVSDAQSSIIGSDSDTANLRDEVANLRREMAQIRQNYDTPPEYNA